MVVGDGGGACAGSQGLEARPTAGSHLLLANRSAARLATGDGQGALADAEAAIACAPPGYTTAFVRQVGGRLGWGLSVKKAAAAAVEELCVLHGLQPAAFCMLRLLRRRRWRRCSAWAARPMPWT